MTTEGTSCPPPTAGELGRLWDAFTTLFLPFYYPRPRQPVPELQPGPLQLPPAHHDEAPRGGEERVGLVLEHGARGARVKKKRRPVVGRGWVSGGQGCLRPSRGKWKGSPIIPWQGCLRHRCSVSLVNEDGASPSFSAPSPVPHAWEGHIPLGGQGYQPQNHMPGVWGVDSHCWGLGGFPFLVPGGWIPVLSPAWEGHIPLGRVTSHNTT